MPEEKRRFPRFPVTLQVELKDKGRVQELVTSDASRHGVFLRIDSPRPVRQLVQLTFQLPEGDTIDVMGMVARSMPAAEAGPQGPGMGVDFFAMSKGARDVWEGFVRTLARAAKTERPTVAPGAGMAIPQLSAAERPTVAPGAGVAIPRPGEQEARTRAAIPQPGDLDARTRAVVDLPQDLVPPSPIPEPEGSVTMRAPGRQERARELSREPPGSLTRRAAVPARKASIPIPPPESSVTRKAPPPGQRAKIRIPPPKGSVTQRAPQRPPEPARLDQLFDELPEDAALPDDDPSAPPVDLLDQATEPPLAPVRRKQPRYVASFLVRLKDKARLRQFYTRDIGAGGMFLKTPLLKSEGDDVQLVLIHPESDQEFRLGGKIARVTTDPVMAMRGMGIRFHPRNDAEERALLTFIDTGAEFLDPSPGERESTLTSLKTAIEVAPDSPRAHFTLGKALLDQDKLAEAMDELNKALLLDEDYLPAHRALQEAYTRDGNTARAFDHLRHVKRLEREDWQDKDSV